MGETEQILRCHAARYPAMEPTDAVKLLYQNEFGGGHLIRDTQACLAYLHREYEGVEKNSAAQLYEQIGNGIVRVHLAALKPEKVDTLGRAFLASAGEHRGSQAAFREKLKILMDLTEEGIFGFDTEQLRRYLTGYEAAGFPAVSHSPRYRQEYHPAYRIILEKYCF